MISYDALHNFSVWLRTGSNPVDINQWQSHTGKTAHLPRKFIVEWGDEKMECPANDDIIVEGDKEGYKHCTEP